MPELPSRKDCVNHSNGVGGLRGTVPRPRSRVFVSNSSMGVAKTERLVVVVSPSNDLPGFPGDVPDHGRDC
jgi:hypothetical protein